MQCLLGKPRLSCPAALGVGTGATKVLLSPNNETSKAPRSSAVAASWSSERAAVLGALLGGVLLGGALLVGSLLGGALLGSTCACPIMRSAQALGRWVGCAMPPAVLIVRVRASISRLAGRAGSTMALLRGLPHVPEKRDKGG
jgi:predicted lipid-binding transport protein (Tim44 family)